MPNLQNLRSVIRIRCKKQKIWDPNIGLCMMYKIHKGLIAIDAQEFMTPDQSKFKCVQNPPLKDGLPHALVFPENDTRVEQPGQ